MCNRELGLHHFFSQQHLGETPAAEVGCTATVLGAISCISLARQTLNANSVAPRDSPNRAHLHGPLAKLPDYLVAPGHGFGFGVWFVFPTRIKRIFGCKSVDTLLAKVCRVSSTTMGSKPAQEGLGSVFRPRKTDTPAPALARHGITAPAV